MKGLAGFLFLLRHELRLGWRRRNEAGGGGRWFALLFGGAAIFVGGWFLAVTLQAADPAQPAVLAAATALILMLSTMMIGHALIAVTDVVQERGDLDLLLSSPMSPWTVLSVRALGVAIRVSAVYLFLSAGALAWLCVLGAWRQVAIGPAMVGLALVCTAIGLSLGLVLMALLGPRAARTAAQVLGALVGAMVFLVAQAAALMGGRPGDGSAFSRWSETIATLDLEPAAPFFLPARAFLGEPSALIAWLASGGALFVAATFMFGLRLQRDAADSRIRAASSIARQRRPRPFIAGRINATLRKEWRLILRDPKLLSAVMLQMLYFIPLLAPLATVFAARSVDGLTLGVTGGAMTAVAASLSASLSWITISGEDAPDLLASAPADRKAIDHIKLAAAMIPILALMWPVALAIALLAPAPAAMIALGVLASSASAGLVALWRQTPGARRDFHRRPVQPWTVSVAQVVITLCWSAAAGFAAGGLPIVSLPPALIAIGVLLALRDDARGGDQTRAPAKARKPLPPRTAQGSSSTSQ